MIEYFATRAIYEEEISKSSVPMLRTPLFAENEHKEDMPQTLGYLHTKLFSQDFAVVSFLADRLAEGEVAQDQFKATLFQTLEKSKKEERYAIGAANAITILNYARTSFSAMDFNDVRIPGADVSYGIFDNTQFQRANLQNVTFTGAWLRQANFTTADMTGVKFGESPYIELSAKIITCTYSHSGDLLAVGCGDGNIYLYEVHSCKQICVFKENERGVRSVTFDPNDTYLASGSWDHKVRLWKVATRQLEHTFEGHIGIVTSVAFSPNGEYVVSGSEDKIICLWEIAGGNLKHKFIGHLEGVYSVSFDKQGKFVASGSSDKTICLWEVSTGKCKLIFKGHSGTINSVAFDPKGKYLVSGSADRTIRFWDVKEGCPVRVLEEHTAEIRRVAFDHKGDRLGCGRSDGVVEIRQLPGCKIERVLEGHTDLVFSVAFDPRCKCLVSTGSDSKLRLWQIEEKSSRQTVGGHVGEVNSVAFDLQGDNVASGGADKIIRIWEIKTGKLKCIFEGHTEDILSVIFNPQGKFLASGSIDKTVRLWEIETRKLKHVLLGHTKIVTSVVFSADGKYVVSGSLDEKICLWEVETGNLKYKLKDMWGGIECMAFDVQKGYLAAAGMVSQIFIWDIATGKLNYMLDSTHASIDIRTIAFDPLGEHLAAGSGKNNRNNIQLWEITGVKRSLGEHKVAAGRLKRTTFKGHTGTVLSIAFAPTGNYLASGSRDRTVRLWDVASGARLLVLHGFMGNVNSISWKQTAKDLLLITGSDDIAVRCWKIFEEEKGKLRAILQWTSHQVALTLKETCIEGVKGLDTANMKLCKQHGAVVEAIQQHGIFSRPPIITDAKKENQSRLTVTPVQIVKTSVSESPGKDKSRCLLM